MEITGGEPDLVGHDEITDKYVFYDCSPRALGTEGLSVMTARGRRQGRGRAFIPVGTPSIWLQAWVLKSCRKISTGSSSETLDFRHKDFQLA